MKRKILLILLFACFISTMSYAEVVIDEGFEGCSSPDLPSGWSKLVNSTSSSASVATYSGTTNSHSGTMFARLYNGNDIDAELLLITPKLFLGEDYMLSFWGKSNRSNEVLYVGTMTDSSDATTFTLLNAVTLTQDYTQFRNLFFSTPTAIHIAFLKQGSSTTYTRNYLDDIVIEDRLAYDMEVNNLTPEGLAAVGQEYHYFVEIINKGTNNDTYDLTTSASSWAYEIRDKDDTGVITDITIDAGTLDTVIVACVPNTSGNATITFIATSSGSSTVNDSIDISLSAYDAYTEIALEDFEEGSYTAPDLPYAWSKIVGSTDDLASIKTTSGLGLTGGCANIYNASDLSASLYLITPAFVQETNGYNLTFWAKTNAGTENLVVGTLTDPCDESTFAPVDTFSVINAYNEFQTSFNAPEIIYPAFKGDAATTVRTFRIDDVSIEQRSDYNVELVRITQDADVAVGTEFNYFIEVGNKGANADTYNMEVLGAETGWTYAMRDKNYNVISSITINAGDVDTVIISTAPSVAEQDSITFAVTSVNNDTSVTDNVGIITSAYNPYTLIELEGFEGCTEPELPFAWSKIVESDDIYASVSTDDDESYEGIMCAKLEDASDISSTLLLVSPAFAEKEHGYRVKFWAKTVSTDDNISFGIMTDPCDASTYNSIANITLTNEYNEFEFMFDALDIVYSAFKSNASYTYKYFYIDNVNIMEVLPYYAELMQVTPVPDPMLVDETFDYLVEIENKGYLNDTYALQAQGDWNYTIMDKEGSNVISTIGLNVDEADTVLLRVIATSAGTDSVTFSTVSQGDGSVCSVTISTDAYEPYSSISEGFEDCNVPDLPYAWSKIEETTGVNAYIKSYSSHSYTGSNCVRIYNYNDLSADLLLITPAIAPSVYSYSLDFYAKCSSGEQQIVVGTMTDPEDISTFNPLDTMTVSGLYLGYQVPVSITEIEYIALKGAASATYKSIYVDDVTLEMDSTSITVDFNGDGYVDATDLQMFGDHWHFEDTDPGWDATYDLDPDGIIDAADLQIFGDYWHEGTPPTLVKGDGSKGPNADAGIVFDLDATTAGNQNLTYISPQAAGSYIRLDVYATGVHNLDTYEFEVVYDSTELEYVSSAATNPITYEENILTTNGGSAVGWMVDDSTPGILSIAYTLTGTDTTQAPEGEGLLADIVFKALVNTHGTLSFGDVIYYDTEGVSDVITDTGTATLPVELSAFTATYDNTNGYTTIEWTTVSETDVIGFNVYRSTEDYFDTAKQINVDVIAGHGTTTEMNTYEFIDLGNLNFDSTYYYWLESVEYGGISTVYSSINITPEEGTGGYVDDFESNSLSNFPNPFKSSTTISYSVRGMLKPQPVEINIYNMLGQLVDTVEGRNGTATWNTSDHSTGIYFYKLNTDSYSEIKKMMVTK